MKVHKQEFSSLLSCSSPLLFHKISALSRFQSNQHLFIYFFFLFNKNGKKKRLLKNMKVKKKEESSFKEWEDKRESRSSNAVILKRRGGGGAGSNPWQTLPRIFPLLLYIFFTPFVSLFLFSPFVSTMFSTCYIQGTQMSWDSCLLCVMPWLSSKSLIWMWGVQDPLFGFDHLIISRLVTILNVISLRKMKYSRIVKRGVSRSALQIP